MTELVAVQRKVRGRSSRKTNLKFEATERRALLDDDAAVLLSPMPRVYGSMKKSTAKSPKLYRLEFSAPLLTRAGKCCCMGCGIM
jgi:hypothetical protein